MAIIEISVVPIGTKNTSLSPYIADCIQILEKEKVLYELTAMGTNIEGNLKDLIKVALKMHEAPFKKGSHRVVTTIKIDDRRDKVGTLSEKKESGTEEVKDSELRVRSLKLKK